MLAIAGALPMEVAGLRGLGGFTRANIAGINYLKGGVRGRDAAIFVSGIGEDRAYETAKAVCGSLPVAAYICVGLSGSLSPALRSGDVVVGESVSSGEGNSYSCDRRILGMLKNTLKGRPGIAFGPLFAAGSVLVSASGKKELSHVSGCVAVDMESGGAARAAHEAGVPFIAIRAVSDALDEDLPIDFNRFTFEGRMDWPRLMFHVLTHPGTIGPLMRLGRNSRVAAENLTDAVARFVTYI